jgi:hypothetical protein
MFEFRWKVPESADLEVVLRVHSRHGWFAPKVLTCDGRDIYRRGRFEGIDARFAHPQTGQDLHLRMVEVPGTVVWRPALFYAGQELPETTGQPPPALVARPKLLAVVTGLTYLSMLMALVMLPSIAKMLDAVFLPQDDRRAVLTLMDPDLASDALSIRPSAWPPAVEGAPYSATLEATGGAPPYEWSAVRTGWPKRWELNPKTGELSFTPVHAHDLLGTVRVTDSAGRSVQRPIAVVVQPKKPRAENWPIITTLSLPLGVAGKPYQFDVEAIQGTPLHTWKIIGKEPLPPGLTLDKHTGRISGTPEPWLLFRLAGDRQPDLDRAIPSDRLRSDFEQCGIQLSGEARIRVGEANAEWVIDDREQRFTIRKVDDELTVYEKAVNRPVILNVQDSSYSHWNDIDPWIIPVLATAVCLLGYWNMRKWGVSAYAILILLQLVCVATGAVPIATTALVLQGFLWVMGAAYVRRMT